MTFDEAAAVGLRLPDVFRDRSFGTPALKVGKRKRLLLRHRPDIDALVVMIDVMDKQLLMERNPDVYFSLPHYDGYSAVLVHLAAVTEAELDILLPAAWRFVTAKDVRTPPARKRDGVRR